MGDPVRWRERIHRMKTSTPMASLCLCLAFSAAAAESPQNGLKEKQGEELARARRESEFHGELHRKRQFPWMRVKGKERVQNRDVYVIEARPADGGPELLCFDTRSGLMVRREFDAVGESGTTQLQFDFDDYRAVEGVKFPFVTEMPKPEIVQFTLTLTEVKLNAPVEDKVFEKPAAN